MTFDEFGVTVYRDPKSKTVWLASGGNQFFDDLKSLSPSMLQSGREALLLYSGEDIVRSPRYKKLVYALRQLIKKYDHYDHIKVTGHSTGSTLLMQAMRYNPYLSNRITFAGLFNQPRANSQQQLRAFKAFIDDNDKVSLFGTELDIFDPGKMLYTPWRDHVLGALDTTTLSMNVTRYEQTRNKDPTFWPISHHTMAA